MFVSWEKHCWEERRNEEKKRYHEFLSFNCFNDGVGWAGEQGKNERDTNEEKRFPLSKETTEVGERRRGRYGNRGVHLRKHREK